MSVYGARWVASEAMEVSVVMAFGIDGGIEDIEGALGAGDVPTAFEATLEALATLANMRLMLNGALRSRGLRRLALLGATDDPVLALIGSTPPAIEATEELVESLLETVRAQSNEIRAALPFEIPKMRKPDGLFPTLRVAKELEQLRHRLGLPPYDWNDLRV
ncbi:MAG: hypothetical protein QOI95_34 [Acidimicrobiaceae bacterium]|jgi:hypothetical protein